MVCIRRYHVKGVFTQAMLLAGPGVLFGAFAMALFLYFVMPLGWSWYLCMLFGSILSATDPVAVVALLKDAGASPKLTILIIGESLMNDGTAMVLFTLYFNMMEGDKYDAGEVILFFIEECLGAPLLGIGIGLVGVYWLSMANNPLSSHDVTIQIIITLITAYLTFFVAQYECEISGVLACCAAGVVFAWQAPPLILEHETMHSVWGFIEWVGNTLIFLLAGIIIGGSSEETHISRIDYLYVVVLYVALMVIRCANVAILFPFLKRTGLKCSAEELGIGRSDADKVFFYVGGVAALTLVVNATTAQAVLMHLGLLKDENNAYDLSQLNNVRIRLHHELMDDLATLETGIRFGDGSSELNRHDSNSSEASGLIGYNVKSEDITRRVSLLVDHENAINDTTEHLSMQLALMYRNKTPEDMMRDEDGRCFLPEMLAYYRTRFLETCRAKYWQYVE
ncbi:NHX8, partial [Symbiodinium microadriaticum]